ncbi:MAG: hypothetical protein U0167_01145 [bacterium]
MSAAALAWNAWPLKRRPGLGAFGAIVVVATLSGVWGWTRSVPLCVVAGLVLFVGVAPFFAPARYRLDESGVEVARLGLSHRRAWTDFGACRREREAVVLSPARRRPWLPRGETLFLEGNGDEVRAYVEEMVGRAREAAVR